MKGGTMQLPQILVIGLVMALAAPVARPADSPSTPLTVTGRVVDVNDQPVAEAVVVMLGARTDTFVGMLIEPIAETKTDGDGQFQATITAATGYERVLVAARREGLAIGSWNGAIDGLPPMLTLRMGAPQNFAGIIVDPSGRPIPGAMVKAMLQWQAEGRSYALLGHESIPELMVKADGQGQFEITAVPEGALACFAVAAEDYAGTVWPEASPSVPVGSEDLSITLSPGASISGTVRCDDANQSVEGLTVAARFNEMSFLTECRAVTDAAGRFTLAGLPVGEVRLVVPPTESGVSPGAASIDEYPWAGEAEVLLIGSGPAPEDQVIELKSASGILVSVLNRNLNEPVAGAQVNVHNPRNARGYTLQTDEHGAAWLHVLPGNYVVTVQHPEFVKTSTRQIVNTTPGQTQQTTLWLIKAAVLSGVVLGDDDQPVAGVKVQLLPNQGQQPTVTDAEGCFKMQWQPVEWGRPVTSMLVMRHPPTERAAAIPIDDPAKPLTVTLQKGSTITGRVLSEAGEPLSGATITVTIQSDGWGSQISSSPPITTDAEGRFRASALPPETDYHVTATAEGYGQHSWRVEFADPDETVLDDAKLLVADQQLSGEVVDAAGKPVADANIQAYGEQQPHKTTKSDAEGKFTLDGLCAGYVNLQVYTNKPPHQQGQIYAKVGRSDVKIIVSSGGFSGEPPTEPVPEPLTGQPMPELSTLGLDAAPPGQPVLVLFFDASQRSSRHAIRQLQAQAGASSSAHVVAVQSGQVDDALLDDLHITLPLARVIDAVDECHLQWGVPGLPWYILADPSGKVVHSGPSLTLTPDKGNP
jgi:uncharacterized GH25 family protein